MYRYTFPLAIAILAGSALVATAQQPSQSAMECAMEMHGMAMGMMGGGFMGARAGMRGGMRGGMSGGRMDDQDDAMGGRMDDSSMMAHVQSRLGLSDAQVQQMRGIQQRACAAAQPHFQMAMQARQAAARELMGDKPNLDHFEDQLDKANKHMVEAQVELAKGIIQFRDALTPAQRQTLDQMEQQMMQRWNRAGAMRGDTAPPRER